ncbi:MAG TPA: TIGR00730 family Rossman fold protein [Geminicoccaceae bacterium]|nr:TIGR00730 family Rossman fold protein [Geminicoccaceae bacterium]
MAQKRRRQWDRGRLIGADEDARAAAAAGDTPQTRSPSFRLAYMDPGFMLREELRPVRLQLELLKPELLLQDNGIHSTIVVFGSARIPEPRVARTRLAAAERAARAAPEDPALARRAEVARRVLANSRYYDEARRFARLAASADRGAPERNWVIMTGGGPGIMEAANRGARDVGALSIGLNIVLPFEQRPNAYVTPELCFQFHYFAVRKMHVLIRARALAIFPGGFGTLDELFDALTLIQTGKIEPMPVLLVGAAFWRRVIGFEAMAEEGVISEGDLELIRYVDTAEEAWRAVDEFRARPRPAKWPE